MIEKYPELDREKVFQSDAANENGGIMDYSINFCICFEKNRLDMGGAYGVTNIIP